MPTNKHTPKKYYPKDKGNFILFGQCGGTTKTMFNKYTSFLKTDTKASSRKMSETSGRHPMKCMNSVFLGK